MSAAICGTKKNYSPDVASLIRATLAGERPLTSYPGFTGKFVEYRELERVARYYFTHDPVQLWDTSERLN
jgi:hypothetical protein